MSTIVLSRLDRASPLAPNSTPTGAAMAVARAEGLTHDEAIELAAWLKDAGYETVEVTYDADRSSVRWSK